MSNKIVDEKEYNKYVKLYEKYKRLLLTSKYKKKFNEDKKILEIVGYKIDVKDRSGFTIYNQYGTFELDKDHQINHIGINSIETSSNVKNRGFVVNE